MTSQWLVSRGGRDRERRQQTVTGSRRCVLGSKRFFTPPRRTGGPRCDHGAMRIGGAGSAVVVTAVLGLLTVLTGCGGSGPAHPGGTETRAAGKPPPTPPA